MGASRQLIHTMAPARGKIAALLASFAVKSGQGPRSRKKITLHKSQCVLIRFLLILQIAG